MSIIKNELVKIEIKTISYLVMICDILSICLLLILKRCDYISIMSLLYGSFYGVFNFFILACNMELIIGMSVNKAKKYALLGFFIRYIAMGLIIYLGLTIPNINSFVFIISLFFVKFSIFLQAIFNFKN